jgi:hypothetical protein
MRWSKKIPSAARNSAKQDIPSVSCDRPLQDIENRSESMYNILPFRAHDKQLVSEALVDEERRASGTITEYSNDTCSGASLALNLIFPTSLLV